MTRPGTTISPRPNIAKSEPDFEERILMGASIPFATVTMTGVAKT